jgi:phage tail-like protein
VTDVADLLPAAAGSYEIAAGKGMSDALSVPIRQIVDPAQTPVAFLPWLAAHESVDLWFEDWSTARKRAMIAEASTIADYKGTRHGVVRFLSYVDATLVDAVAYPAPFVMGRSVIGRNPIGHKPFLARYLIALATVAPPRALVARRGVLGRSRLKTPSREKFDRALRAIRAAKAPETQVRVDFAHHRVIKLSDQLPLDGTYRLGQYVPRTKL